jgi:hypothetical protein
MIPVDYGIDGCDAIVAHAKAVKVGVGGTGVRHGFVSGARAVCDVLLKRRGNKGNWSNPDCGFHFDGQAQVLLRFLLWMHGQSM